MIDMTEHEGEVLKKLRECPQFSREKVKESKLNTFFVYHCIFIILTSVLWLMLSLVGITYRTVPTYLFMGWGLPD